MRVVPADPALPALQDLFPASGAPEFVCQAVKEMAGVDVEPVQGRIAYVRYRPTRSCVISWSFAAPSGRSLLVSGRMFHNDHGGAIAGRRAYRRLAEAASSAIDDLDVICPYRYLPERRLLLQLFPLDRRLPALSMAGRESWMRDSLLPSLGGRSAGPERIVEATPLNYKPWRRCVYQYHVESEDGWRSYFGKMYRDDRGRQMLGWLRTVHAELAAGQAPWRTVEPVAYLPDAKMLLLQGVEKGVELKTRLKDAMEDRRIKDRLREQMVRMAEGLGPFQRTTLGGLPPLLPRDLVRRYERQAESVPDVAPDLARSLAEQFRRLEAEAARLPPETVVPTHGAFRHDQFIVADDKLVAIDLDTLCASGASADAGNFLGYLDVTAVRRRHLRPVIEECKAVFRDAAYGQPFVNREWLAWYWAASHVKKALRSFFSLDRKWSTTVTELLQLAEETLASP